MKTVRYRLPLLSALFSVVLVVIRTFITFWVVRACLRRVLVLADGFLVVLWKVRLDFWWFLNSVKGPLGARAAPPVSWTINCEVVFCFAWWTSKAFFSCVGDMARLVAVKAIMIRTWSSDVVQWATFPAHSWLVCNNRFGPEMVRISLTVGLALLPSSSRRVARQVFFLAINFD